MSIRNGRPDLAKPPKAFFFNVPAHGHVNPSLPLVAELVRRGHQITYFLPPGFRATVEATGAALQPYAAVHDDYFSGPGLDGSRPQKAADRLITTAGEILPELLQAEGRRLIYVSLGSLIVASAAFFRTCIAAFGGSDDFVLISTGRRFAAEEFGALPLNVAVLPWVPQAQVLQRAALFVTHGGQGSVLDGLYCGVPLLVVPQQEEQLLTARRVVELGAGLLLRKVDVSVETIRAHAAGPPKRWQTVA